MNYLPRLSLNADDGLEHLKNRAILERLGDFIPRSASSRGISLDPELTVEKMVSLLEGYSLVWSESKDEVEELILTKEGTLVSAFARPGHVSLEVFSEKPDAREVLGTLARRFEPFAFQNKEQNGVWAEFAHLARNGVSRNTEFLRCPPWEEIRENYAPPAREGLEKLFNVLKPWKRGRLIIWHGPPGTGKTYAIRALMMIWRKTFDFIVINDPENLSSHPGYYYQVASPSSEAPARTVPGHPWDLAPDEEGESPPGARGGEKRRIFIMEDTADLILQESRSSHYDKIGKLLNMTDGLFGQGREDLFLLTFNEDVERIDPAFLRPGRCIVNMEFPKFKASQAAAWFRMQGLDRFEPRAEMTLAEMYAKLFVGKGGVEPVAQGPRRVGFSNE
jgi:hypothetical protein